MSYCEIETESVETNEAIYQLFAVFESSLEVVFVDSSNSDNMKFKDIFSDVSLPENIFFSCNMKWGKI